MTTAMEKETGKGDPALTTVTGDKMIVTEQDLGTKREEEEVLKDLHNQGHILVPGREATDQLQQADPKEALPEEDSEGHIQEEGITENTPETVMTSNGIKFELSFHKISETYVKVSQQQTKC